MSGQKKRNYGWLIVAYGALVMSTLHYTCFNSFGLFVVPVTEGLGISRAALSLTMTIGSVGSLLLAPVAGKLLARGNIKRYLFGGILVSGLCIFCEGFATSVYQLYALVLLLEIASTFALAMPFSTLMLRWFDENRAFATSVIFVGVSMGGVLFASPVTALILARGWRTAYHVIGLVILCIDAPLCLLIVRNYPDDRQAGPTTEKTAKRPQGAAEKTANNMQKAVEKTAKRPQRAAEGGSGRKKQFWLLTAGLFCNSFACVALYHIPAFVQSLGGTAEFAARLVSFYSFVNIFAKLLMGCFFDRLGMKAGVLLGVFGNLGCYLCMVLAAGIPGNALLFAFAFLFGIGLATQSMFVPSLISGIYGEEQYSIIYGRISVFTLMAGGISNPVISMVYDRTGSYQIAWILCAGVVLLSGLCLLSVCRTQGKTERAQN